MVIKDFNSFFEVLAVSNLGFFATSITNIFGDFSNRFIERLSRRLNKQVENINSLRVVLKEEVNSSFMQHDIEVVNETQEIFLSKIKRDNKNFSNIPPLFQPLFIVSAIFCLIEIILGGLEQYQNYVNSLYLLYAFNLLGIYNILIFLFSYFKWFNKTTINPLWSFCWIIFVFLGIRFFDTPLHQLYSVFSKTHHERLIICIAIFVAASPFIFFILRLFSLQIWNMIRFGICYIKTFPKLRKLNRWLKLPYSTLLDFKK